MNLITFAQTMTGELDKAVVSKPVTGFFADNALRSRFVGAKTVLIPEMEMSGLGDYDRDTGFVKGHHHRVQPAVYAADGSRSFVPAGS